MQKSFLSAACVLTAAACVTTYSLAKQHTVTRAASIASTPDATTSTWETYGGQPAGDHYSSLDQINKSNVSQLKVAWTYDTGEPGGLETNPIIVGKVLYATTPRHNVIALDAVTGKLL